MRRTKTITRTFGVTKGVAKIHFDPNKIMKEIEVAPDEQVLEVQIESTILTTYTMPIEQFVRLARLVNNDDTEEPKVANTKSEE